MTQNIRNASQQHTATQITSTHCNTKHKQQNITGNRLKILQWNIQGLKSKLILLEEYVLKNEIHIILL